MVQFLRVFGVFCFVFMGLVPLNAVSQTIYIKKNSDSSASKDGEEKPKIFVAPSNFVSKKNKNSGGIKYKHKLKVAQDINFNKKQIELYEDIQKSGYKPKTVEEMVMVAQAEQAVIQQPMLERRKKLIAYLEKKQKAREAKAAREAEKKAKEKAKNTASKKSKKKTI